MTLTNYEVALIAGCFTLLGVLIGSIVTHRLTLSRDKSRAISEINKALLDEVKSLEIERSSFHGRIDREAWLAAVPRLKLGSVNFTAFKKTCTPKQQQDLDAAYNKYTADHVFQGNLIHLKNLVENIINERT